MPVVNLSIALLSLLLISSSTSVQGQALSSVDRERGHVLLSEVKGDIKKNYYDPLYHGVDIETRFKEADQQLDKATSLGQVFGIIAQAALSLNDSHTFFIPPSQTVSSDYGWLLQAIGDQCFVVAVKPGSDAEAKGLKPGDLVLSINGIAPQREELWKLRYLYYQLRPQAGMHLVVRSPEREARELDVLAKVQTSKRTLDFTGMNGGSDIWNVIRDAEKENQLLRHRYTELGNDVFIWKMPSFDSNFDAIDALLNKARHHKALVLDLRGNSGGSELTLLDLIGRLFEKDVNVGTLKRRKENKPLVAKGSGQNAFTGKLVVLVDADSASAAEVFARVIQLEKRGVVIGDRTAGAVMRSRYHPHQMGMDVAVFFGISVTDADIIMSDGNSLERNGVAPDEGMIPTAKALATNQDPVLSRAVALADGKLDPQKAGNLFPREWAK